MVGSHNSLSYLPVKQWYLKPFAFMAKCQNKSIKEQLLMGIRYFDVRVRFTEEGDVVIAHGLIEYKGNVFECLQLLDHYAEVQNIKILARLILEDTTLNTAQENYFIMFCNVVTSSYSNLIFHCGRRKGDWKQIYDFHNPELPLSQKIASMTGSILDDWWPWLYAKLFNKRNIKNHNTNDILLLDFV